MPNGEDAALAVAGAVCVFWASSGFANGLDAGEGRDVGGCATVESASLESAGCLKKGLLGLSADGAENMPPG